MGEEYKTGRRTKRLKREIKPTNDKKQIVDSIRIIIHIKIQLIE